MKLGITQDYKIIIKELYDPIILRTQDNVQISICMRDFGFEIITQTEKGTEHLYTINDEGIISYQGEVENAEEREESPASSV